MRKKLVLTIVGCTCLIFMFMALAFMPAYAKKAKIAVIDVKHYTGAYAAVQAPFLPGVQDFQEWVNEVEYIPGAELEVRIMDGGTSFDKTLAATKQALAKKPRPLAWSGGSTGISGAMRSFIEREKLVGIAGGYSVKHIQPPGWFFNNVCPYDSMVGATVDFFLKDVWKKKRAPRMGWLTWDNAYGRSAITPEVEAYIRSKGVDIVAHEYIPLSPVDTTVHLLRLKKAKVDFVTGTIFYDAFSVVVKDAARLGLLDAWTWCPYYNPRPEEVIKAYNPALSEGMYFILAYPQYAEWSDDAPYKIMYDRNKRNVPSAFYLNGWAHEINQVEAIRRAATRKGARNITPQDVYNEMCKLKNFKFYDLANVTYSKTDRCGLEDVTIYVVRDGKMVCLHKAWKAPELWPGGRDVPAEFLKN